MANLGSLIDSPQSICRYRLSVDFLERLLCVETFHRSVNIDEADSGAYLLPLRFEHIVVMTCLQQVIPERFLDAVECDVCAVYALELVDEVSVIDEHDEVGVSNNPPLGIEKISFKIDVQRPAAFLAGGRWQCLALQSIATAFARPVAPCKFGVIGIALYEFLDDVVAVEVPHSPKQLKLRRDTAAASLPPFHVAKNKLPRAEEIRLSRFDDGGHMQAGNCVVVNVAAFMATIATVQRIGDESIRK